MRKIEKDILVAEDQEMVACLESFTSTFNMIGVAGAIIVQVAITALSLPRLAHSPSTSEACFVAGLITGSLSVFFACMMSPELKGLHDAKSTEGQNGQSTGGQQQPTEGAALPREGNADFVVTIPGEAVPSQGNDNIPQRADQVTGSSHQEAQESSVPGATSNAAPTPPAPGVSGSAANNNMPGNEKEIRAALAQLIKAQEDGARAGT
ncbi:hypothetical protein BCR34DRAFT_614334 [Clohesyomyces aquaticus]|uniref:Uncharacterized protein n=1 Tax=Clohesyomyces aquaticus TaxID=1231657 RepID=A0A1Y1ZQ32_9PLEO|nr:hypothetical protein BCR34DRAFT_614334 [Clohesyomyces aquaticus]